MERRQVPDSILLVPLDESGAKWTLGDSNPQPSRCKRDALPLRQAPDLFLKKKLDQKGLTNGLFIIISQLNEYKSGKQKKRKKCL